MTALTSLDEKEELQAEARTTTPFGGATPTLKEFAEDLRHRIAAALDEVDDGAAQTVANARRRRHAVRVRPERQVAVDLELRRARP
jgi:hypothetical protein